MRKIILQSVREECGGCPTHYSGETVNGRRFEAYLRHGFMRVELEDITLFTCNPSNLDGVCNFDDFVRHAKRYGIDIDSSNAEWSSKTQEDGELIWNLFKDQIWVEFIDDLELKSSNVKYKKGQKYTASLQLADTLVKKGYAIIVDENIKAKREEANKSK